MQEKKVQKLIIDKQFQQLIPPLQQGEYSQLEENIKQNGCREPICVFKNTIIDGHNRYAICTKHNIPFNTQEIEFTSREEIIIWICANQLGRRNISIETKKYLIGKRYEAEKIIQNNKNINGLNQYNKLPEIDFEYKGRNKTAKRLGLEYNISDNTVKEYSKFARSIDYLNSTDPDFSENIMSGSVKISHNDVKDILTKLPHRITAVKERVINKNEHKNKPKKITVKDMPSFDPDAEIMSLAYTIPSWVGSMERVLNKQDFSTVSNDANNKLKSELQNLKYTADTILLIMEENNGRL